MAMGLGLGLGNDLRVFGINLINVKVMRVKLSSFG